MKRYICVVESIDWTDNTCRVRVPNLDGLDQLAYIDPGIRMLTQYRTPTEQLEKADIPFHLQGLRVNDIVYCMDSEQEGENYAILGFYGGVQP